jgi:hypothetical protein
MRFRGRRRRKGQFVFLINVLSQRLYPWALATNGSKWQLFGNILAAEGQRIGRFWQGGRPQRAAEWQRNGNKWQQAMGRIWGVTPRARKFRELQGGMAVGRKTAHLELLIFIT